MDKFILLTGGTGFIGSHLCDKLLENNCKVLLLKRSFSDLWRINHLVNHDNLVLADSDDLPNIFNSYDIEGVIHLATAYIKNHDFTDLENIVRSNIEFPSKLIDLSVNSDVKYFINTGTFSEYCQNFPITESSKIEPWNYYSASKVSFEDILKYYYTEHDIHCATLKIFTPYGPRDNEDKIIPYLITNTLKGDGVKINNPNNRIDIVHVYDIVDAYLKLNDMILKFKDYEVFNVGNDVSYSIDEIYSTIRYNLGLTDNNNVSDENHHIFLDNSKIKNRLNWNPKIGLNEGIKNTIEFYKDKYNLI